MDPAQVVCPPSVMVALSMPLANPAFALPWPWSFCDKRQPAAIAGLSLMRTSPSQYADQARRRYDGRQRRKESLTTDVGGSSSVF
jgi:hypothetical protein